MTRAISIAASLDATTMIDLIIEDEEWARAIPEMDALAQTCQKAATTLERGLDGEIALLASDDEALCALNERFRGKNTPTNVLSFPSDGRPGFLGDIALAREICVREAAEKGISLHDHTAHLIVHGMLHLIGYDHQETADAEAMERREAEILALLGISDPYEDAAEAET